MDSAQQRKSCPTCRETFPSTQSVCDRDGSMLVYKLPEDVSLVGTTVDGRYLVERLLAEGGMGRVYVARQLSVDRHVALKVLRRAIASDVAAVQRFQNEARAASRLTSAHTVTVYDFGQEPSGLLYLAMEYVQGRSLYGLIAEEGRLLPERAVGLAAQVLDSLAEAHAKGIVHRDIKPDNVLLTETASGEDWAKVTDFGIAKVVSSEGASLTSTGMVVGTPRYASPEQVRGEPLDARSDLYSTGVMLYEMLAGVPPFQDTTPMKVMVRHMQDEPPHLIGMCPKLPSALAQVVHAALAKRREDRPQSATELRTQLLDAVGAPRSPRAPSRSVGHSAIVATARSAISGHEPTGIAESPAGADIASDATGFMDIADMPRPSEPGPRTTLPAKAAAGSAPPLRLVTPPRGEPEETGVGAATGQAAAASTVPQPTAGETGLEPSPVRRRSVGTFTAFVAGIGVAAVVIAFLLMRTPASSSAGDPAPPDRPAAASNRSDSPAVDEAPPVAPEKGAEPGVAGQEAAALEQEGGADAGAKAGAEPVEAAVGEPPEGAEPGSDIVAAARAAEQAGQGTGAVEAGAEALVASATPGEMADATAQPVEAAEPARRTVRIESTPNGALVLEGDAELGATPLDVEVAQGAVRTIVLKSEGFKSHELELSDGSAPELDVALEKERAVRPKKTAQSSPERPAPKDQKEPAKGGSGDLSVPYLD